MWFWLKISICQSSMVHEGCWGNCPTRVGNLEASTTCWRQSARRLQFVLQPGSRKPHLARSSGGPYAQSGGQAKKAPISSWGFAQNCHSPFKCAQDNSPAQMLQTTSCSAVVCKPIASPVSRADNQFSCNKSCYCSITLLFYYIMLSWIISK